MLRRKRSRPMIDLKDDLIVSTSPHVRNELTVQRVMGDVLIALAPAFIISVYFFGLRALLLVAAAVVAAVATEAVAQKIMKVKIAVSDLSAVITGVLLAFNLPAGTPLWMAAVGSIVAIGVAKMSFGGLGKNIFNPALIGRAVLLSSFPVVMTKGWLKPLWYSEPGYSFLSISVANPDGSALDAISSATPLIKTGPADPASLLDLVLGRCGGCIGETCAVALIIGGLYLLLRGHISWQMPLGYLGSFFVLMLLLGGDGAEGAVRHLFMGGLMLGAWFMATDMVTSPLTSRGQLVGGVLCGLLTFAIRLKGGYPEGVSYSILIMNAATPLIDKVTVPKKYGAVKKNA